jgi:Formyl transferase
MSQRDLNYVVICGYERSRHAIAFLAEAVRSNIKPAAILLVNQRSFAQIRTLVKRHGKRGLLRKVAMAFRERVPGTAVQDELAQWKQAAGLRSYPSVTVLCHQYGIEVFRCSSLNIPQTCEFARARGFQFAVYLGGGILKRDLIRSIQGPIFNAHSGPLPQIRGMNAVEWALYEGLPPTVTVHRIDEGIDTGEIYFDKRIDTSGASKLDMIRGRSVVLVVELLLEAVRLFRDGRLTARPNSSDAGRQYFTMHPYLTSLLEERLSRERAS